MSFSGVKGTDVRDGVRPVLRQVCFVLPEPDNSVEQATGS